MKRKMYFLFLGVLFYSNLLNCQLPNPKPYSSLVGYLPRMNPSPIILGMGGSAVAVPLDDSFSYLFNPAQVGISNISNHLNFEFNPSFSQLNPHYDGVKGSNIGINGGIDLRKYLDSIPLFLGMAYSDQFISDFGLKTVYYKNYSQTSHTLVNSNLTLGLSLNYKIRFSLGITIKNFKDIYNFEDSIGNTPQITQKSSALDLGGMVVFPLLDSLKLINSLTLNLFSSLGFSYNNFGSSYNNFRIQNGPISSTVEIGYGITPELIMKMDNQKIKLLKVDFTSQAMDYNPLTDYKDRILGRINFWDNVILMKGYYNTYGFKVGILETIDISFSTFYIPENYYYNSEIKGNSFAYSVNSTGLLKIINLFYENSYLSKISKHLNIKYSSGFRHHFPTYNHYSGTPDYNEKSHLISINLFDLY